MMEWTEADRAVWTPEDERVWELAKSLVAIDSSDPGAYEGEIEGRIFAWLRKCIAEEGGSLAGRISLTESEALPGRKNLMARIPGVENGPGLIYICHMDTVMLGDGWSEDTPPLGAVEKGGKLYGRGACDMKSGLACALEAFRSIVRRCGQEGKLPKRTFSFIGTVDEEDFMRGAEKAISDGWVKKDDWILDTEPTDGRIRMAHKGRTWFELTLQGITAHASTPWKGADAVAAMAEAIRYIRLAIAALPEHPELGRSTVTFGQIQGGYRPYVVPDSCTVWIDMRLVPPADTDWAKRMVEAAAENAKQAVPGVTGTYVITGDRPGIATNPASGLMAELKAAAARVTGACPEVIPFTGYTDTAVIAGTIGNRDCMSYGPGSLEMAHKPNEYVPKEDVRRCRRVLKELAQTVLYSG